MQERQGVVDILDFGAPVLVFMNFVNVKVFASAGKKSFCGIQQGVGAEIDVIGTYI